MEKRVITDPDTGEQKIIEVMDEENPDKTLSKDFPLVSGLPDENTKRIVLHDYESQVVINEIREKTKPKDIE